MTAADIARSLVSVIGAEAAAPIIRAAIDAPAADRKPLLEDAYENALCFVMSADEVRTEDED